MRGTLLIMASLGLGHGLSNLFLVVVNLNDVKVFCQSLVSYFLYMEFLSSLQSSISTTAAVNHVWFYFSEIFLTLDTVD